MVWSIRRIPEEFLFRHIGVSETWCYHYTPETKKYSKQNKKIHVERGDRRLTEVCWDQGKL